MITYPDWFRVEKETHKIISRLSSINELSFYLRSPEQFIRRLAILRVGELKLSDGIGYLSEIIENLDEDPSNRNLAAWALKSISSHGQEEILVKDRLLTRFSGQESLKDVMGSISIKDPFRLPDTDFVLPENSFSRAVQLSAVDTNTNFVIENSFSLKDWIFSLGSRAGQSITKALKSICAVPGKLLKQLAHLFVCTAQSAAAAISKIRYFLRKRSSGYWSRKPKRRPASSLQIKKGSLLPPSEKFAVLSERFVSTAAFLLRTVYHHLVIISLSTAALFILFINISPVNTTIEKYSGINASQVNYFLYSLSNQFITMVSEGASDLLYGEQSNTVPNTASKPMEHEQGKSQVYAITAKNGLTLRTSPTSKSPPIGSPLPFQSTVTYLDAGGPSSKDEGWYRVKISDGRIGWVYSKWLKERR